MIRMPYVCRRSRIAKRGFLIIELVIALGVFSFFCTVIGWVHVTTMMRQKDTLNYLEAVTGINHSFELLQQEKTIPVQLNNDITIEVQHIDTPIKGYEHVIITASFIDTHAHKRSVAIEGAILKDTYET